METFQEFKNDIDKLLKSVDFINILGFVGGEPTLSNDLAEMIEYACSKKQIHQVFLATNCTILPSEKLIKAMQNKKFAAQLSDYSHVKNIKNGVTVKYDKWKDTLVQNHIRFNNYQEKREANTWFSLPEVYIDEQDAQKVKKTWRNCVQICNILSNGILLPCTMSVHIYKNLEHTKAIDDEVINIRNLSDKELTKRLTENFKKPNSAFCHYCHFENIVTGLPCGEQIE